MGANDHPTTVPTNSEPRQHEFVLEVNHGHANSALARAAAVLVRHVEADLHISGGEVTNGRSNVHEVTLHGQVRGRLDARRLRRRLNSVTDDTYLVSAVDVDVEGDADA